MYKVYIYISIDTTPSNYRCTHHSKHIIQLFMALIYLPNYPILDIFYLETHTITNKWWLPQPTICQICFSHSEGNHLCPVEVPDIAIVNLEKINKTT